MLRIISLVFCVLLSSSAFSEVNVAGRQVYILYPGIESIWGSYLFMVNNSGTKVDNGQFKIMLPIETEDFEPQQGINPKDIQLGEDGGVFVNKDFPPGDTLVTVGFKIPSSGGVAKITINPTINIPAFSYFVSKGSLKVEGMNLDFQTDQFFSGKNYDTYTVESLRANAPYSVNVLGSPEGRNNYWLLGAVVGIVLLLLLVYAYFVRPNKN